jgi:hypothetical protein
VTLAGEHKEQLLYFLAPQDSDAVVSKDVPWVKVIVHNASLHDNFLPRSDDSLLDVIQVNSCLRDVTATPTPRLILPPIAFQANKLRPSQTRLHPPLSALRSFSHVWGTQAC